MSELTVHHNQHSAVATGEAFTRLAVWAESARAAHQMSQSLVHTSFVPQQFRGKPEEATAAILAGAEVGLSPMASLRSFDIIQGTAAPRALTLRAIVQSQGHEIRVVESTETRAVVAGRRRGDDEWQRSLWTLDRAKSLGLLGKDNWKKQPGAMLVARATAEVCRWVGSDAIAGIAYAAEELADDIAPAPTVEAAARPAKRTAQRRPIRAVPQAPEPSLDESTPEPTHPHEPEPELEAEVKAEARMVTEPQKRRIFALLNERGITDRDKRLAGISTVVGRQVASTNELTSDEAARVIDSLQPTDEPAFDDQDVA